MVLRRAQATCGSVAGWVRDVDLETPGERGRTALDWITLGGNCGCEGKWVAVPRGVVDGQRSILVAASTEFMDCGRMVGGSEGVLERGLGVGDNGEEGVSTE